MPGAMPPGLKPILQTIKNETPLPEHRQKQVEAGLSAYQNVLAERDMLERQLRDAIIKIDSMTTQLASMQGIVNMMESAYITAKADLEGRVREYQQQRDHAVARVASLDAHLMNAYTLIKNAVEPEIPT